MTLRNLGLAAFIGFLFCFSLSLSTHATSPDCATLFSTVTAADDQPADLFDRETAHAAIELTPLAKPSLSSGPTPFFTARFTRRWLRWVREDAWYASVELAALSPTYDDLDNFSSPALLKPVIFAERPHPQVVSYLQSIADQPPQLAELLLNNSSRRETLVAVVDLIESRHRTAWTMTALASGGAWQTSRELYAHALLDTTRHVLNELQKSSRGRQLLAGIDPSAMTWSTAQSEVRPAPIPDMDSMSPESTAPHSFAEHFVRQVSRAGDPLHGLRDVGRWLGHQLNAVPVGISYRLTEPTSTIRFADHHFFGSLGNFTDTERKAYLRESPKMGGTYEILLNVSNAKKKMLALMLDRTHRQLDPIGQLPKPVDQCFYTCGTFAPLVLIKSGVPVISPAYLTPAPALFSLTIQRLLGLPNVQSVRWRDPSLHGGAKGFFVVLFHDGMIATPEIALYAFIFYKAGSLLLPFLQ